MGNAFIFYLFDHLIDKSIKTQSFSTKKEKAFRFEPKSLFLSSSGDTTRTCDLRVMSPTSYQLLHPAIYFINKRIRVLG